MNVIDFLNIDHDFDEYLDIKILNKYLTECRWKYERERVREMLEPYLPITILILKLVCIPSIFITRKNLIFSKSKLIEKCNIYSKTEIGMAINLLCRLRAIKLVRTNYYVTNLSNKYVMKTILYKKRKWLDIDLTKKFTIKYINFQEPIAPSLRQVYG